MTLVQRVSERILSRVLPTTAAEAVPCCGGGCGYQYRCLSSGTYQKRYCCSDCQCRNSCGAWQTIPHLLC